jgi:hypothetical protein
MGALGIVAVWHILYSNNVFKKNYVAQNEKCIERSRQ